MFSDYLKLAFQGLKKRGLRSWLTMLGIFIGIAAVVSLISLGQGLELAVGQQFQALGADRITVQAQGLGFGPPGAAVANPLTKQDLTIVQRATGVDGAAARLVEQVTIQHEDIARPFFVGTFPEERDARNLIYEFLDLEMEAGRDLQADDRGKITLGHNFYDNELLGSTLSPRDKVLIQGVEFEVVGIYKRTGSFQTDAAIIMNEQELREILDLPDKYSAIIARASNVDTIDQTVERIKSDLRRHRDVELGREDFSVQTSQQTLESIGTILTAITIVIVGIAGLSLVVGGIGIMNTMYTSVLERTKEIGIMKAIGARNSNIFTLFFIESGLLGLAGGVIGIIIGIILGKAVEIIGRIAIGTDLLQASFTPNLIIGALIFSFVVGTIAGTLPARQASKMNPVDALRK